MKAGEVIKKLRQEKKMNVREFAKKIQIQPSDVCLIEMYFEPIEPNILENIAKTLDTTVEYLMSFEFGRDKKIKEPEKYKNAPCFVSYARNNGSHCGAYFPKGIESSQVRHKTICDEIKIDK